MVIWSEASPLKLTAPADAEVAGIATVVPLATEPNESGATAVTVMGTTTEAVAETLTDCPNARIPPRSAQHAISIRSLVPEKVPISSNRTVGDRRDSQIPRPANRRYVEHNTTYAGESEVRPVARIVAISRKSPLSERHYEPSTNPLTLAGCKPAVQSRPCHADLVESGKIDVLADLSNRSIRLGNRKRAPQRERTHLRVAAPSISASNVPTEIHNGRSRAG